MFSTIAENYKFEFDCITEHFDGTNNLSIYDSWVEKIKENAKQLSDFMFEFKDSSRLFIVKYATRYQCTVCH
jgi:hypothetical protein